MKVERIDSDGLWLKDDAGTVLPLSEMSDGYRASLAMLTDIVRQMVDVYGHEDLVTISEDGALQVAHHGVVLIDEVDSHLHPEWQRQIGFWLKRRFPNIQFIVTSHSPFICQAADDGRIYHLPAPGNSDLPFQVDQETFTRIITSKADEILLTPAFNLPHTRSPLAVKNRQRFAELKAKESGPGLTGSERQERQRLLVWADGEADP